MRNLLARKKLKNVQMGVYILIKDIFIEKLINMII